MTFHNFLAYTGKESVKYPRACRSLAFKDDIYGGFIDGG